MYIFKFYFKALSDERLEISHINYFISRAGQNESYHYVGIIERDLFNFVQKRYLFFLLIDRIGDVDVPYMSTQSSLSSVPSQLMYFLNMGLGNTPQQSSRHFLLISLSTLRND